MRSVVILAAVGTIAFSTALAQERECGLSQDDWCSAPAGDPCGRHKNAAECRADYSCYGLPFRGVTKVGCLVDRRGFSLNCPTVGCRSRRPDAAGK